jgi:glucose-6-phosphate isomerase
MIYQHNTDHCFDPAASHGITAARLNPLLAQLAPTLAALNDNRFPGAAPLVALSSRSDDLDEIEALAAKIRGRFRTIVVAGTGGSGLSGRTLIQLAPMACGAQFYFMENIDPCSMDDLLDTMDIESTCFLIISKSGSTAETLCQFYILLEYVVSKIGRDKASAHFVVITVPGSSPLRDSANEYGMTVLDHPSDIGGRYSVLTCVGLLPAAIAGLDIRALRRGAHQVVSQMQGATHPQDCFPAIGAALQYAFIQQGYPLTVMLPYSEQLAVFGLWYRQCWAESLGKKGKGSTPIPAIGATDQHSQLQLYLDGPKDKLFHMIMLDRNGKGRKINAPARPDLDYLRGRTMGDLLAAEQQATLESLVRHGCPVRVFALPALDEEHMGALLMHFMLEIIFTSALLDIDPFDQPAVEEGKILARQYLMKAAA